MRLFEVLSRFIGRVEIALAFADDMLRDGERALAEGAPLRAETHAKAVLERVPGSVLALALLADARAALGATEPLVEVLEELSTRAPSRAEVWVRLGAARAAAGRDTSVVRDAYLRGLGVAAPGSDARRDALLALTDLDLGGGDAERAELWLAGIAPSPSVATDLAVRRAEIALERGDAARALAALAQAGEASGDDASDGRLAMARARALALAGRDEAFVFAMRAYVLEVAGASELLSSLVGWLATDAARRAAVRALVEAHGEGTAARWRAAFARAEGRKDEARTALVEALATGDVSAAGPLLDVALADGDAAALDQALAASPTDGAGARSLAEPRRLANALRALRGGGGGGGETGVTSSVRRAALRTLASLEGARVEPMARAAVDAELERLVPKEGLAHWDELLSWLDAHSRALHDLGATARIAELASLRARPVRLAVVGEFNAGKSTFVNALMGVEAAPTGVLPTTATQHLLRYGADPLARIFLRPDAEAGAARTRTVPVGDLKKTLASLGEASVAGVEIELPLATLSRVEILDTPGFNAPNERHTTAARQALEEADVLLWLLDAAQPLKQSERTVLEVAKAAKIPVQLLVNKADRLSDTDRQTVSAAVAGALAEAALPSLAPPRLFSAKLALAGKLGQEGALERSGWADVERVLDEEVVAKSDVLKERALRRRAASLVAALREATDAQAATERAALEEQEAKARALTAVALRVERDEVSLAGALARSLASADEALERDLAVTAAAPANDADGALARYRVERALARFPATLAAALAGLADGTGLPPAAFDGLARLVVRTVALAARPPFADALGRAATAALVEHLRAAAQAPTSAGDAPARARELAALAARLG